MKFILQWREINNKYIIKMFSLLDEDKYYGSKFSKKQGERVFVWVMGWGCVGVLNRVFSEDFVVIFEFRLKEVKEVMEGVM